MQRDIKTGKFLPAPIKIGDVVVTLLNVDPELSGFTPNKGYKVLATSKSKVRTTYSGQACWKDTHFIILDDWGNTRRCEIGVCNPFQHWEKVNYNRSAA